jgi:hypothetical protein
MTFEEIQPYIIAGRFCHRMSDDGFLYSIFNGKNLHSGLFVSDEDFELEVDQGICIRSIPQENIIAISPDAPDLPLFESWDWIISLDDLTATDWQVWPDVFSQEDPDESNTSS